MACVSPFIGSRSKFGRKLCSESDFMITEKKKFIKFRCSESLFSGRFRVLCRVEEGNNKNKNNGEEPPESLFMQELKKRGMTPSSLLEDKKKSVYEPEELKINEEDRIFSRRSAVSTNIEKDLSNQRERSMQLNSEGLEGLIPRAKLLLSLGGTFFLAFGPLILITVAFFSGLYFYFGPSFIHDGSKTSVAPPPYIDPYTLLEEERISQTAPFLN
ncbi:tubulin alpha-6 chain [Thalictrum thalictroides]|uniref:Tubulin alpha-6 chain n=1 Tax=Thalictrum thalictroides TaxID=46969 RepID=A0A7J6W0K9_THATH|nr:tubulin alpha-6 chain [Thalictrum thalictroides]